MANVVLTDRGMEERALPPIWKDGNYSKDRIEWYARLILEDGRVLGGESVIAEFLAAMILESNLDNLIIGNNAKNGSNNAQLGIGWCQLDTGWHVADLDVMHDLRADPLLSLQYVLTNADLSHTTPNMTWFNKRRWNAWWDKTADRPRWERLDPTGSWSPYLAALTAVRAVSI